MNIEKAIEFYKAKSYEEGGIRDRYTRLAIEALEKQLNGGWIPFKIEYDEDYKMGILQGKLPDDEQEILVTDGKSVWMDTFTIDEIVCYLDSGTELISEAKAWMPKPKPYKED